MSSGHDLKHRSFWPIWIPIKIALESGARFCSFYMLGSKIRIPGCSMVARGTRPTACCFWNHLKIVEVQARCPGSSRASMDFQKHTMFGYRALSKITSCSSLPNCRIVSWLLYAYI